MTERCLVAGGAVGTGSEQAWHAPHSGVFPKMSVYEHVLNTGSQGMYNVTGKAQSSVTQSGVKDGLCVVFCTHTTAGITINENADPDVVSDMLLGLDAAFPDRAYFRHGEGNSSAHLKASAVGASATVIIDNGRLLLGTWQGVYFCEFDGPRTRKFLVKVM